MNRWDDPGGQIGSPAWTLAMTDPDPAAQLPALLALVAGPPLREVEREVIAGLVAAAASRPFRLDGGATMETDAVRGLAAWWCGFYGVAFSPSSAPFLVAMAARARGEAVDEAWWEWGAWLAGPARRWPVEEAEYRLEEADLPAAWCALVRCDAPEAFRWYRSGVVMVDEALQLGGALDAATRAAWRALVEVRPGPRDWRGWHDDLAGVVAASRAARRQR